MKFKTVPVLIAALATASGCEPQKPLPLVGTWELISATSTEKDSTFSTFDPNRKMIKIINATHFAFLNHAVQPGKDSTAAAFSAGGGTYTLADSTYTENLDYFVDKQWENHKFRFTVRISNDTLTQTGIEKLEKLGIDRIIVEKYKRVIN
ncbi:hypothetical protein [Larkinella rosea]|uniref:Lipocalin-like domain-containing protein n=1 Tax=Larkinella rosea TaxID=2025312 RepID=A0A3P1BMQ7_9BACT|nr:hypothetical protein [Larkinella rosea]RRB02367.1 hypothetical protein EHT25_18015 [Larkinella rosea]